MRLRAGFESCGLRCTEEVLEGVRGPRVEWLLLFYCRPYPTRLRARRGGDGSLRRTITEPSDELTLCHLNIRHIGLCVRYELCRYSSLPSVRKSAYIALPVAAMTSKEQN